MNEELTREALELMKRVDVRFISESVVTCMGVPVDVMIKRLATALLAEMDKPKVWDGAPEWAKVAHVGWYENNEQKQTLCCKCYTRELPKTRTRIMAEEIASAHISNKDDLIDIIEQTINAHMEELKVEA